MKVLMVCLGNICRSPLAEGILQHKINELGLDWQVESRGTGGWHVGNLPDSRSIAVALKHGLDITYQRSEQLKKKDLSDFDLIYAMDRSNYFDITDMAREDQQDKVKMILNEVEPDTNKSVPDPYYGNDGFENVYDMLEKACSVIVEKYAV